MDFIKELFSGKVTKSFEQRSKEALSAFENVLTDLKDINYEIKDSIEGNNKELERLEEVKLEIESNSKLMVRQEEINTKKINKIESFLED